ncbi:MAG: hypothetical protein PW792_06510 [Acidobacteriaceae bacterium]|nr:hypothetical protein [Acidobacteriaceae bacterium]
MKTTSARSVAWLYAVFFVTGTATVLAGNILPLLARDGGFRDGDIALALATQFGGQLVGPMIAWKKPQFGLGVGCVVVSIAAALLPLVAGPMYFVTLAAYGFGLGIAMTMANVLVGLESSAEDRVSRLELLNIFWPLGAAFCGWWLGRFSLPHLQVWPQWTISIACAIAALWALLRPSSEGAKLVDEGVADAFDWPRLAMLAFLALLVVGVETGIANWLPSFAVHYQHGYADLLVPLSSAFWLGILGGRLLAAKTFEGQTPARWTMPTVVALSLVGVVLLATGKSSMVFYLGTLLAAVGVAPVYPALLAEAMPMRGKGIVFVMAGIGSALLPWVTGRVAVACHTLRFGFAALAVCAALLLVGLSVESFSTSALASHRPH